LFEQLFGVGTIKVHSSDKTHPEFEMPGIENVEEVTRMIDEAQRKERHARAAYVESV